MNLEHRLYEIANDLVGSVGESTEGSYSVTGEDYVMCGIRFTDEDDAIKQWREWTSAYMVFAKHSVGGIAKAYSGESLTVYWRQMPEIGQLDDGTYVMWARLLISYAPRVTVFRK